MAANTFHLVIASVGESRFDGSAISATIPTSNGEITVLAEHEPIVATLKAGEIRVKDAAGEIKTFAIEGGVLEVSGSRVVVLL